MALSQRIASLQKRKAEIDIEILAQTARPLPDTGILHKLKAEKLGLKDSIERLVAMDDQRQAA